ncbi:MAG: hypothetical protein VCC00_11380 [Deltaproteobacteria bacterium]
MPKAGFWAIESGVIRFARDGHWYSDDEPVVNRRIATLFARQLCRREDEWWIVMGDEKARVVIDDTPWVVVRVDGTPASGFTIGLNDGSRESLQAAELTLGAEDVLYTTVKDGPWRARFLRAPQVELLSHAVERDGAFFLPDASGKLSPLGKAN